MKTGNAITLVIFIVLWSSITLLFDNSMVFPVVHQFLSGKFPATEGVIRSGEVVEDNRGEDGSSYSVKLTYQYTVAGKEYSCDRYRYGTEDSCCPDSPQSIVNTYPPGSRVRVYYNPRNPADAVLSPGVRAKELYAVTFMTPFNLAMLGLWGLGVSMLFRGGRKSVAGGVKIIHRERTRRIRLTGPPLATGLIAAVASSLLCVLIEGLVSRNQPNMQTMVIIWIFIPTVSIGAYAIHRIRILAGKYDLVIDDLHGTIELPATQGRQERRRVAFANLDCIRLETEVHRDADGDASYAYIPTLHLAGVTPETERLNKWYDESKARAFVDWLRTTLPKTVNNPRGSLQRYHSGTVSVE